MRSMVCLAWLLTAPLATAINLRKSLSFGKGRHDELTTPARTNVSKPYLLPAGIVPKRYDIHLAPDLSTSTFFGEETITVDVVEDGVAEVVLHAKQLRIETVLFTWPADPAGDPSSPPRKLGPNSVHYDSSAATVIMRFPYSIPRGEGRVYLQFFGQISDEMAGLYRAFYTDAQGVAKTMLATQMEPLSARAVFPCWDEPARKAVFKLAVTMPILLQAISNMPVESEREIDLERKRVTFVESAVMSTYLLALVVGEFDYVEAVTGHGVQVRAYTPKGRSGEGEFALGVASKVLDYFDDYFGIPYPLPKLDLVSIPEFSAGAMENWGLITFRENLILIDKDTASAQQKQEVGIVTAHELAHQWFGNLVTMAWWDDLWLNEGFATWMEYCGLNKIHPEYDLWSQFSVGTFEDGLTLDELVTSHPIQVPIDRAEEVSEVFDAITYKKGAAIINMLHALIGEAAFREGLHVYLTRHAYSSAKTVDLWNAWSEVTGLAIDMIMKEWTQRAHFPYVRVTFERRAAATGEAILELEQLPFVVGQPVAEESELWSIPITAAGVGSGAPPIKVLMRSRSLPVAVPVPTGNAVALNVGRPSPIRVLYAGGLAGRMAQSISTKALPPPERATYLYDYYRLMHAGKHDVQGLAYLLGEYRDEDTYVVWAALQEALLGMGRLMAVAEFVSSPNFQAFAGDLVDYGWAATGVGWEGQGAAATGHVAELLRGVMVALLTKFRWHDLAVQAEARRRYTAYVLSPTAAAAVLPAAIRTPVLQLVLKTGGMAEFNEIMSLYNRSSSTAQEHILRAIGHASSAELKMAALHWSISGAVKTQDAHYVFGSVSESSPEGLRTAWTFLKLHIIELSKKLPTSLLNRIITYSTSGFCTHRQERDVVEFFSTLNLPGSERALATATEKIRTCANAFVPYRFVMTFFPTLLFPR